MTDNTEVDRSHDDQAIFDAGYKPQLKRSLGLFSSFAVSFSTMSITTCIFANFGFVLTKAGPFGFWTWPIVAFGVLMVALVFAEMAGRMPLSGYAYSWNNKLANRTVGWFTGWMALVVYCTGAAAVATTMVPVLTEIVGVNFSPLLSHLISVSVILIVSLINIYGIRLASHTNLIAVIAELIGMVGLTAFVLVMLAIHGHAHFDLLTTIPENPKPYMPAFLMSCLLGAWTFIGFESSADMSEETIKW